MQTDQIQNIFKTFKQDGEVKDIEYFSNGLINTSCKITADVNGKTKEYVVQKINKNVFKHPEDVMHNISSVTNFIRNKIQSQGESSRRRILKFYKSNTGKYYSIDENGDYWRMYKYIDHSIAPNSVENIAELEEVGKAFGEFQQMLTDFPAENLKIIIPHFHNTQNRYELFKEAIKNDVAGRAKSVSEDIAYYLDLESIATKMYAMQKSGKLKLRVTHNDTKCNNVLLDESSHKYLCAIDLDTVMPGLVGFDFGDAIRFGASTASEDEKNISLVGIDFEKYNAFTKGFLSKTAGSLEKDEVDTLALGAITMTLECGLRFLTDYLNGDTYFKTRYKDHNLDRARCQLQLGLDMLDNYSYMKQIVEDWNNYYINLNKDKTNESSNKS